MVNLVVHVVTSFTALIARIINLTATWRRDTRGSVQQHKEILNSEIK